MADIQKIKDRLGENDMSIKTSIHDVNSVVSRQHLRTTWLDIMDKDGNVVTVFIPEMHADAMADAWADAQARANTDTGDAT